MNAARSSGAFLVRLLIAAVILIVVAFAGSRIVDALTDSSDGTGQGLLAVLIVGVVAAVGFLWFGWPQNRKPVRTPGSPQNESQQQRSAAATLQESRQMLDAGLITEAEFEDVKKRILAVM